MVKRRIEDYALIGNARTAALVSLDGSIDWLCLPRFDSPACFAALLGDPGNGRFRIGPAGNAAATRTYRDGTLVLETTFAAEEGTATLTDCMVFGDEPRIVRSVRGREGSLAMAIEYVVRYDYGSIVPWLRQTDHGLLAVGGPDSLLLAGDVPLVARDMKHVAEFVVKKGETYVFELTYAPSHLPMPAARASGDPITATERFWRGFSEGCAYEGPYREAVIRSLVVLRALTYVPSGGIVAAPTASLPELIGGVRNWDYRYCWLRDATFTLYALLTGGHKKAATDWRAWLLRAIAGEPDRLQIVYGILGHRRLPELELPWLTGFEDSTPVRVGNAADDQFQLDVYGEVIDLLYAAHRFGIEPSEDEWNLSSQIVDVVEKRWREPDRGMWEVRGNVQHFTHSKVMAWVALDRGVRAIEEFGFDGPLERWRIVRDEIHADVCANGYDLGRNAFMQAYGSSELDASALLLPLVGFLPPDDPRILGTIAAIERELMHDGFVYRYSSAVRTIDGLPPGEGAFLACSFWLVDNYTMVDRMDDAAALFERLMRIANDVGLLAEEYDPIAGRQLGNFPQAFSHVGLINSAFNIWHHTAPAMHRSDGDTKTRAT